MTDAPELWFFALFPPPALGERAAALAGRPERAAKMHVTLLVPAHPVDGQALRRAGDAVRAAPFDVVLDRIESGFGASRCRILSPDAASWAALERLHAAIREAVVAQGVGLLRETYRPHLTLARGADEAPVQGIEPMRWRAERFRLTRSVRRDGRYVEEGEWRLRE